MVIVESGGVSFYMDKKLQGKLDLIKKGIKKKDKDWVCLVDGSEGAGKSTFAMQIAKYLDPSLDLSRICMNPQEFMKAVSTSRKGQAVVYDEAYSGLASRMSLSQINHLLVSHMTEMRQKNLFVIIVLPTFFMLDRYVAIFRSKALFHVYEKRSKRGRFVVFTKRLKKLLHLRGRKEYNYNSPKSAFKGRFSSKYVIDEAQYRKKKHKALKDREVTQKPSKYIDQRNAFILILREKYKCTLSQIANLCLDYQISLKRTQIHDILKKSREK